MSENTECALLQRAVSEWNAIRSEVCELHWSWTFHKDLWGNPKYVRLTQQWQLRGPFKLIRRAFLFGTVIGVGRLLDPVESPVKGKGMMPNLSLNNLVAVVEPHLTSPASKSTLETLLSELQTLCEPIKLWRNTRIGHADKGMMLGLNGQDLPDVDPEIIDKILGNMYDFLKVIHTDFSGSDTPMPFHVPVGYADALMSLIQDGVDARNSDLPP